MPRPLSFVMPLGFRCLVLSLAQILSCGICPLQILLVALCFALCGFCQNAEHLFQFASSMDIVCALSFRSCQCPWQQLRQFAELSLTLASTLCLALRSAVFPFLGWTLWTLQPCWILWISLSLPVLSRSTFAYCSGPNYCVSASIFFAPPERIQLGSLYFLTVRWASQAKILGLLGILSSLWSHEKGSLRRTLSGLLVATI